MEKIETEDNNDLARAGVRKHPGPGGTPGGAGQFFCGLIMAVAGGYLLMNHMTITTGFWHLLGFSSFGLTLVPLLIGIGMLFYNGKSAVGWILTIAGLTIIVAGVLANLQIYFQPTSLFNTLIMFGLLAGGVGLVARSLKDHGV
jgi:hypothetical protein